MPTSGGYRLRVSADRVEVPAQEGKGPRTSSIVFLQLNRVGADAEYFSRDTSFEPDGTVEADWGASGRVEVRFVALHSHSEPVRWCGGPSTVETGVLVGSLVFHGEHGYATARATTVPATLTRRPESVCHIPASVKPQRQHDSSSVRGSTGRHGRQIGFYAFEHPALGTIGMSAVIYEVHGGVSVTRLVSGVAPLSALTIDPKAETAMLLSTPPFTGSATFKAFPGKEAGTWRGDLAADFPGKPGVRLAGKRFHGAMLKPGECAPDGGDSCIGIKAASPIGIKPALPFARLREPR